MIKYLLHTQIDKQKWDQCISNSFNGIIYAYSWYLDTVCTGWEALVENDYERVFPLTGRKKAGINYLFQPIFSQQLGVFSINKLNEDIIEEFIAKIPEKFLFAEINLNTFNKINSNKHTAYPYLTHELDLIPSYEKIYFNYSENTKRNIKQAEKSDLSLTNNITAESIIHLFRKNKGKDIKTLNDKDFLVFQKLINICLLKKIAHIRGVLTNEKKLCAGAIFVETHKKVIFLFSATNNDAKASGAMSFLINAFIKENAQHNLTLDFEGSNNPNLARFYKSFGSKECNYYHYKKNNLPWLLLKSITFIKWFRNKFTS